MSIKFIIELPQDMSVQRSDIVEGIGTPTVSSAFRRGFLDGLETPDELGSGMTYDNLALSEAYDKGVNLGQSMGRLYGGVTDSSKLHDS